MDQRERDLLYVYDLFHLKHRVAIITGGMGQLGTEYAEVLLKASARVVVFDITSTPNERLMHLARNYPLLFKKVDVTNEQEVKDAVTEIEATWDVPRILINNAGWRTSPADPSKASVPFEKYPMDIWDAIMKTNVASAAICSKIVGGRLIELHVSGVIINIASHYAHVSPDQRIYKYREAKTGKKFVKDAPYSASKAAIIALTRDLATQWAPYGIRVVCFSPGGVQEKNHDPEFVANYSSRTPLGRMAHADEYQGVILFLASDASSYMTGANITVDGGYTAW